MNHVEEMEGLLRKTVNIYRDIKGAQEELIEIYSHALELRASLRDFLEKKYSRSLVTMIAERRMLKERLETLLAEETGPGSLKELGLARVAGLGLPLGGLPGTLGGEVEGWPAARARLIMDWMERADQLKDLIKMVRDGTLG